MSLERIAALVCSSFLLSVATPDAPARNLGISAQGSAEQSRPFETAYISPEELKEKMSRSDPLAILDVRVSSAYADSDSKIRGAIRVKLRRLKTRLAFPPLSDVPRDREVVTYCSCSGDETSIRAARILFEAGFKRVRVLKGGWQAWLKSGGPVESRPRV